MCLNFDLVKSRFISYLRKLQVDISETEVYMIWIQFDELYPISSQNFEIIKILLKVIKQNLSFYIFNSNFKR